MGKYSKRVRKARRKRYEKIKNHPLVQSKKAAKGVYQTGRLNGWSIGFD